MRFPALEKKDLPDVPPLGKFIGVGIVVMGLAMGTGELILWPHLITKYGLHLLWLALLGITFQYFINQEVARYSLATGESFFTSTARLSKWFAPFWFFAGILLYMWPGWASAIGTTLRELTGFGSHLSWAYATLGLVLVMTFSGKIAYHLLEKSLKIIVPAFFLLLVFISFYNLNVSDVSEALRGLVNFGGIPKDIDVNVLLGAIVFAGAGGMLNLCVSLWYRDKGLGMGHYAGRITNPITGTVQAVSPSGFEFDTNDENIKKWKKWMKYVRIDQGLIFWSLGLVTLVMLSLNAYVVLTPKGLVPEGLNIAVVQAHIFGDKMGPVGYNLFLFMAFLMLFSVMWTVIDALTRITGDIIHTNSRVGPWSAGLLGKLSRVSLSHLYYILITLFVIIGAFLLPLKQPLTLLNTSAVLGGLTMAVYTPILMYLNNFKLHKKMRPGILTNIFMAFASLFFLFFAWRIVVENIF